MRQLAILIILGIASPLWAITGVTPQLPDDSNNNTTIQTILDQAQGKQFRTSRSAPTLNTIGENEIVLVDSATFSLWTRSNGILYSVELTKQRSFENWCLASATGTPAIQDGDGVSAINSIGGGNFDVIFSKPFSNNLFSIKCTATTDVAVGTIDCNEVGGVAKTTTSVRIFTYDTTTAGGLIPTRINFSAIGH